MTFSRDWLMTSGRNTIPSLKTKSIIRKKLLSEKSQWWSRLEMKVYTMSMNHLAAKNDPFW